MRGGVSSTEIPGNSKIAFGSRNVMYQYEKVGFISAVFSIVSTINKGEVVITLPYQPINSIYVAARNDTGDITNFTVDGYNLITEFENLSAGSVYRIGTAVLLK